MIKIGDNPEGFEGINKFLCGAEGLRGVIIATHPSKKKAIIKSLDDSIMRYSKKEILSICDNLNIDQDSMKQIAENTKSGVTVNVKQGGEYLISEISKDSYPIVLKQVRSIPKGFKEVK